VRGIVFAIALAGCASEVKEAPKPPKAPAAPTKASVPTCPLRIDGNSDLRFVSAMHAELARIKACRLKYRVNVSPVPFARDGNDLRLDAKMLVFRANGDLAGEVPVTVAIPGGAREDGGEARLLEAAGKRAAQLLGENFP
jgi:hypothetical protein